MQSPVTPKTLNPGNAVPPAGSAGGSAGTANLGNGQPAVPSTWLSGGVLGFEDGGTVPGPEDDPSGDGQPADPNANMNGAVNDRLALALTSVDMALAYGRKLHGLPSDSGMDEGTGQQAANMPMIPGNQSETPGPYKPQPKEMAANMPMIPGNQSETPGPYKPQQPQPQQMAAAMPMIPGNQSETPGPYKPQQPQPQQVASNDQDGDDAPVIPGEEETA